MPSYAEVDAELCAPGQFFEIETVDVRGTPTRTWKGAADNIGQVLDQGARAGGDRDYIVLGDERLSHQRHYELVGRLAAALVDDFGVAKGDRVAIAMRNLPEWSVAFFAATIVRSDRRPPQRILERCGAGIRHQRLRPQGHYRGRHAARTVAGHLHDLGAAALVGTRLDDRPHDYDLPENVIAYDSLVGRERQRPVVAVGPDDPATIFYTSGTTSHPKGVLGTHRNICANLISLMYSSARTARRTAIAPTPPSGPPVLLVPVPLFHATGCHSILFPQAFFGGTLIFMRKWDPEQAST